MASRPTPLNDQRWGTRGVLGAGGFLLGLILANVIFPGELWALVGLLGGAVVAMFVLGIVVVVHARSANVRLQNDVEAATGEVLRGAVRVDHPVPGRVVTNQPIARRTTGVLGHDGPVPAAALVVLDVLPTGADPRRVAVLAPQGAAMPRRSHHLVALHPDRTEAGVLVAGTPTPGVETDQRWSRAPTFGSIVGGYPMLLLFLLGGLALGIGIGALVILL
ncbi:hypothetical protein ACQBAR_12890 [Propionibacteriaceae bacterium Y1685]